jgi:hypothetical protein
MPASKKKPAPVPWDDSFYVRAYELARTGMTEKEDAHALGVTQGRFSRWKQAKPALANALDEGHDAALENGHTDFLGFVAGRLPPHLLRIWNELELSPRRGHYDPVTEEWVPPPPRTVTTRQLEQVLTKNGKQVRQMLFIHSLIESTFNVSLSLRKLNIPRKTYEQWLNHDVEFAELMREVIEAKKDFFESSFIRLVRAGNVNAVIYGVQTQCIDRGYGRKAEIKIDQQSTVNVNVTVVDPDVIDAMPLEVRRKLAESIDAAERAKTIEGAVIKR